MSATDLALLIALSTIGGALLALGGFHNWRSRVWERDLWGDPDRGRRPLPDPDAARAHRPAPPPDIDVSLAERIELAEVRLEQAREALAALRREGRRQ